MFFAHVHVFRASAQNISDCFSSTISGETVVGRDGKTIEGARKKIEGQVPMFDVTTRSGQTHTFRINSIAVQSRLTSSLDNQNIDKDSQGEHGAWISAIKRAAGLAARRMRESKAVAAVAAGFSQPLMQTHAAEQRRDEQGGQGLEQHYAPSVGLHVRQEAGHRLPSRQQNRRRINGPLGDQSQQAVEGHQYVSTFVACTQENGPAERAGLLIEDELQQIETRNIAKMEWPSVLALLEGGPAGTHVRMKMARLSLESFHNTYNQCLQSLSPLLNSRCSPITCRHASVGDRQEEMP